MNQERLLTVLLSPHVSEKSSYAASEGRQYVFRVAMDAKKPEILAAVEQLFEVKVSTVRTCVVKGKTTRFGGIKGRHKNWKKAYVTLQEGSEISMGDA